MKRLHDFSLASVLLQELNKPQCPHKRVNVEVEKLLNHPLNPLSPESLNLQNLINEKI